MLSVLRMKLKTLATASKALRTEERRAAAHFLRYRQPGAAQAREEFHNKRVNGIREESRSGFLAYGFLIGNPYSCIEQACHSTPDFDRVEELVLRHGTHIPEDVLSDAFDIWLEDALSYISAQRDNPMVRHMSLIEDFMNCVREAINESGEAPQPAKMNAGSKIDNALQLLTDQLTSDAVANAFSSKSPGTYVIDISADEVFKGSKPLLDLIANANPVTVNFGGANVSIA